MDAINGNWLVQIPPVGVLVSIAVSFRQMLSGPLMAAGATSTETTVVVIQPVAVAVNVIVAVPGPTPVTTPVIGSTVATVVGLLLHVPPPTVELLSVIESNWHTTELPDIANGSGLTVITFDTEQPVANV
jgi:hypothetical protein